VKLADLSIGAIIKREGFIILSLRSVSRRIGNLVVCKSNYEIAASLRSSQMTNILFSL